MLLLLNYLATILDSQRVTLCNATYDLPEFAIKFSFQQYASSKCCIQYDRRSVVHYNILQHCSILLQCQRIVTKRMKERWRDCNDSATMRDAHVGKPNIVLW